MGRWLDTVKPKVDWKSAWKELAVLTYGLSREDPRFPPIQDALGRCNLAYRDRDHDAFLELAGRLSRITCSNEPTSSILRDQLEEAARNVTLEECAVLLGQLERIKFVVLTKITNGECEKKTSLKLTIQQVAERLNIPVTCAYELVRKGKLKAGEGGQIHSGHGSRPKTV